jgi:hypothetical protein
MHISSLAIISVAGLAAMFEKRISFLKKMGGASTSRMLRANLLK